MYMGGDPDGWDRSVPVPGCGQDRVLPELAGQCQLQGQLQPKYSLSRRHTVQPERF